MRRCKQCLKSKPAAVFSSSVCAPCVRTNKLARPRGLTAPEVVDMVMAQKDFDLPATAANETLQCKFCQRVQPMERFWRCAQAVRFDVRQLGCA